MSSTSLERVMFEFKADLTELSNSLLTTQTTRNINILTKLF